MKHSFQSKLTNLRTSKKQHKNATQFPYYSTGVFQKFILLNDYYPIKIALLTAGVGLNSNNHVF